MQVPFIFGPGDLRLCDIDPPSAGPRDVVLRVASVGICGSDIGMFAAGGPAGPAPQPFPIGHELSGTIIEAGSEVTSVHLGDRLIVNPLVNLIGNGGPEGGFAEHLLLRDVVGRPDMVFRLPDNLSMDEGALVEPLAVAMHAVNRMGVKPGDKLAIYGAGPIGLAALVVLRHRNIGGVAVFDFSAYRRGIAEKLGAAAVFHPRATPPAQALAALHGTVPVFRKPLPQTTHYLEVSGAPVLPDIVGLARAGAVICITSVQKKPVTLDFQSVMAKELTLTGTLGYPTELAQVLDMLKDGKTDLAPMISHRFAGADFLAAFETAQQPDRAGKVLVQYAS